MANKKFRLYLSNGEIAMGSSTEAVMPRSRNSTGNVRCHSA